MTQPILSKAESQALLEGIHSSPCPVERWWLLRHAARFQLPDEGEYFPARRVVGRKRQPSA